MSAVASQTAQALTTSGIKRSDAIVNEDVDRLAEAIREAVAKQGVSVIMIAGDVALPVEEPALRQGGMLDNADAPVRRDALAGDLLAGLAALGPGSTVADVLVPGMTGSDVVRQLSAKGVKAAVIVISARAEPMDAGATGFLERPILSGAFPDRFPDTTSGAASFEAAELYNQVLGTLTPRQRDVLAGLLDGLPNKLIAYRLGLSTRTVEKYRAAIMDRTRAKSLSELVRISVLGGL